MSNHFAERLRELRTGNRISQQKLAKMLFVDRSTVASWETGRRIPDAAMISRIANCLGTDVSDLLGAAAQADPQLNIILVDDIKVILTGSTETLQEALPNATVHGFVEASTALDYARKTRVDLAFLDIEIGYTSGFDLCRDLMKTNPNISVIFLTAYQDYALPAWNTGACGFLMKPLTVEKIRNQLDHLRFPMI
jgi:transcriptional regulator with XRE-family HTH domain